MPTKSPSSHQYVVIVAGGIGTRLWPASRQSLPKQFHTFVGDRSLLQGMVDLATMVVPLERTFIVASERFVGSIREQLPELDPSHIFVEPAQRDTGPACTYAMLRMHQYDPEAEVAMLWADHVMTKPDAFAQALGAGFELLAENPNRFICIGAQPTAPETGFGYIQMGSEQPPSGDQAVFKVRRFVEKPDLDTAKKFVSSWEYLWNLGYNLCGAEYFLRTLKQLQPELAPIIEQLAETTDTTEQANLFEQLPKQAIDIMLIQKLPEQLVLPADLGWSDVGSWNSVHQLQAEDAIDGMVTRGPALVRDSRNSLVYAKDRLIAVVGVDDLIVVDTGDTILIMRKDCSQQVKQVAEQLKETNPELL